MRKKIPVFTLALFLLVASGFVWFFLFGETKEPLPDTQPESVSIAATPVVPIETPDVVETVPSSDDEVDTQPELEEPIIPENTDPEEVIEVGGILEGTVRIGGQPITNQRMVFTVSLNTVEKSLSTDSNGFYQLTFIDSGMTRFHMGIQDPDTGRYRTKTCKVSVEEGKSTVVDFDFPRANASLSGMVSRNGEPVARARIILTLPFPDGNEEYTTQADNEGFYSFEGLPPGEAIGEVCILGLATPRHFNVNLHNNQNLQYDIDFSSGANLVCHVISQPEGYSTGVMLTTDTSIQAPTTLEELDRMSENSIWSVQTYQNMAKVNDIEPGTYLLIATAFPNQTPQNPEDRLELLQFAFAKVTIQDGDTLEVDLEF